MSKLRNNGSRWNDDGLRKLMAMWQDDESLEDIASELNTSRQAISKMVVRLRADGIPLKKRQKGHLAGRKNTSWTQSDIEYLFRRRQENATADKIGEELGRTPCAINAMIGRLRQEGVGVKSFGQGMKRLWNAETLRASILSGNIVDMEEYKKQVPSEVLEVSEQTKEEK